MRATPENSVTVCEYSKCGKTFVRKDTRLKHCSDSCKVRKSRMKTREKELKALQELPSTPNTLGQQGLSVDQFNELKALLIKLNEDRVKDESSVNLMNIVESGLGYVAGKAAVNLLGKSTLEEKVDFLIRIVQQSIRERAGTSAANAAPAIKNTGLGMPQNNQRKLFESNVTKGSGPNVHTANLKQAGAWNTEPLNNSNSTPPANPILNSELWM